MLLVLGQKNMYGSHRHGTARRKGLPLAQWKHRAQAEEGKTGANGDGCTRTSAPVFRPLGSRNTMAAKRGATDVHEAALGVNLCCTLSLHQDDKSSEEPSLGVIGTRIALVPENHEQGGVLVAETPSER